MDAKDFELKYQGLLQRFTTTMGSYEDTIAQLRVDLTKLESENNELRQRVAMLEDEQMNVAAPELVESEVVVE